MIMSVKKIDAFKTSDDTIFTNKVKADEHEKETQLYNKIEAFADEWGFSTMTCTDFKDILIENIEELREIIC